MRTLDLGRSALRFVIVATVSACSSNATTPPLNATALPAWASPVPGVLQVCEMALASGRLEAASGARLAWLVLPDGAEVTLVWPPRFGIRFVAQPEIIAPDGTTAAVAGRDVELTGGFGVDQTFRVCAVNGKDWFPG